MKLNGVDVALNQEIPAWQLGGLTYVSDLYFFGMDSFNWNGSDVITVKPHLIFLPLVLR